MWNKKSSQKCFRHSSTIFPIFMIIWSASHWTFSGYHLKANTTHEVTNIAFGRKRKKFVRPGLCLKFYFLAHVAIVCHLKIKNKILENHDYWFFTWTWILKLRWYRIEQQNENTKVVEKNEIFWTARLRAGRESHFEYLFYRTFNLENSIFVTTFLVLGWFHTIHFPTDKKIEWKFFWILWFSIIW